MNEENNPYNIHPQLYTKGGMLIAEMAEACYNHARVVVEQSIKDGAVDLAVPPAWEDLNDHERTMWTYNIHPQLIAMVRLASPFGQEVRKQRN